MSISAVSFSSSTIIFKNDVKLLRISLNEYNGVKKISLDKESVEVVFGDSKKRVYSLEDGSSHIVTGKQIGRAHV